MIDTELLEILACPCCKGRLEATDESEQPEGLACSACSLVFPIQGSIHILLKEEGIPLHEWRAGTKKRKSRP